MIKLFRFLRCTVPNRNEAILDFVNSDPRFVRTENFPYRYYYQMEVDNRVLIELAYYKAHDMWIVHECKCGVHSEIKSLRQLKRFIKKYGK
jgi:hypothetical protein